VGILGPAVPDELGLVRSVGIVAADASALGESLVLVRRGRLVLQVRVAVEAEVVTRLHKYKLIFRSMRVVALYAIAFHRYFMTAFRSLRYNPFMTLTADLVRVCIQ
jgi:hypothetical protein